MARAKLGAHMAAISGTIGDVTYVNLRGQQVLRRKARPGKRSPGQNVQPGVIRKAAAYWRQVKADPAKLAFYRDLPKTEGLGPYHCVVRDYCNAPVLEDIDASAYAGRVGSVIQVKATDDTAVSQVTVRIMDMDGRQLEEGAATEDGESANWIYLATRNLAAGQSVEIRVTVRDYPGNSASRSCVAYVR